MAYLTRIGLFVCMFACLFHFSRLDCYSDTNEIRINGGAVRGSVISALNGRPIYSYRGMPYAEKPVRFKPPVTKKPWRGVLNATQDGPKCVQRDVFHPYPLTIIGQEDCLYLSVYTPTNPKESQCAKKKLPVMVWIYGGGWYFGSNEEAFYGPEFMLMRGNVVMVTFNYRLNAFGFLATNDRTAAGNWGLLDQALALKWVNQNIQYFGGDPDKVTLFGNSVGGVCPHLHCFSSLTKGLFHGMISQSGTAYFAPYGVHPAERAAKVAKELAEACECPTSPSSEMVDCLRRFPANQLIEKQATLYGVEDGFPSYELPVWTPVYDVPFCTQPFFRCNPNSLNCSECSLPWINGITEYEGSSNTCQIYANPGLEALIEKKPFPYLSTLLQLDAIFPKEAVPAIMDKILHFYFHDQPISRKNGLGIANVHTDFQYYWPAIRASLKHPGIVYFFLYDYIASGRSFNTIFGCTSDSQLPRPTHFDDDLTLFPITYLFNRTYTNTDIQVIKKHVHLWIQFATTLDPTGGCDGDEWDKAGTEKSFKYLSIGKELVLKEGLPFPERYYFWERIAQEYSNGRVELRI